LGGVICPPYDVISPVQQKLYYRKSEYNAIRLELPAKNQGLTVDRYQTATITFQKWLREGIFRQDSLSHFYLHRHQFEYSGETKVRQGLIARVKLEPWGNGIYPHEETASKAKGDRLQLLRACRASFSPPLCLYHDGTMKVASILSRVSRRKPLVSVRGERSNLPDSGEGHFLWAITDQETTVELSGPLGSASLYVADGHHRYEAALCYSRERAEERRASGSEPFDYVMMELVDFSDPGLVVRPLHRLVWGIPPHLLVGLATRLRNLFVLEPVMLTAGNYPLPAGGCLGILGLQPDAMIVLKKRHDVSLDSMMPCNRSRPYREFGVSVLNHVILDMMLGGRNGLKVTYTPDVVEVYRQVTERRRYDLAFILNPPEPEMVKAIADAQDRMPSKSTYFHPKVPAGLVINSLELPGRAQIGSTALRL